jgi:hypothetical protein
MKVTEPNAEQLNDQESLEMSPEQETAHQAILADEKARELDQLRQQYNLSLNFH